MSKPSRKTLNASALAALVAALIWAVPTAHAAPIDVIRDCSEDGTLEQKYSQRELSSALDTLPSDLDEYTDCRGVIRRAQLAGVLGKGRKGILGRVDTAAPPSPPEQQEIEKASASADPVEVGGRTIRPGTAGRPFTGTALASDLPTAVLAALVCLAAAMLGGVAFAFERRWPGGWKAVGGALAWPARRIGDGVRRGIARFRR
jgi:hypothetical protein